MPGSLTDPVVLDPWQNIIEAHWGSKNIIVFGGSQFGVSFGSGVAMKSATGDTWTSTTPPHALAPALSSGYAGGAFYALEVGPTLAVATGTGIGTTQPLFKSTNTGTSWINVPVPSDAIQGAYLGNIAAGILRAPDAAPNLPAAERTWVILAGSGEEGDDFQTASIWGSFDGGTTFSRVFSKTGAGYYGIGGMALANGYFFAGYTDHLLMPHQDPNEDPDFPSNGTGAYVVRGRADNTNTSGDPSTEWSSPTLVFGTPEQLPTTLQYATQTVFDFASNGSKYLCVGWGATYGNVFDFGPYFATSTDGLSWSSVHGPANSRFVACAGKPQTTVDSTIYPAMFVAVGTQGVRFAIDRDATIMSSADGASWSATLTVSINPASQYASFRDVVWVGDRFIAVGAVANIGSFPPTESPLIYSSIDGTTWTPVSASAISAPNGNWSIATSYATIS